MQQTTIEIMVAPGGLPITTRRLPQESFLASFKDVIHHFPTRHDHLRVAIEKMIQRLTPASAALKNKKIESPHQNHPLWKIHSFRQDVRSSLANGQFSDTLRALAKPRQKTGHKPQPRGFLAGIEISKLTVRIASMP
ncbi:hypothetical protein [Ectopseudomonas toyotomiensis]|uniref:Uncharacterized protein n=1 Tax=Ectopseudomonas toyotomiensis TaxID=554344 RepID=A0AA42LGK2_9GAMM|nr:hypothetical protein [Pseudomonas toyotomiensis]MBG0842097.1 hypothetical protein [Pseudomonas toyotomiensis]MDH0701117.1 hypothetical protein [Pseudomonas toyotomiensis]